MYVEPENRPVGPFGQIIAPVSSDLGLTIESKSTPPDENNVTPKGSSICREYLLGPPDSLLARQCYHPLAGRERGRALRVSRLSFVF